MRMSRYQELSVLVDNMGIIRPRDLDTKGIPRTYLQRMVERGALERIGRGLYCKPDFAATPYQSLLEVSKLIPSGVICLLSALAYYEITTQLPHQVWIALPVGHRTPRIEYPPLRTVHVSDTAFAAGVDAITIERVPIRIYNPAKTVADCFKFRNKIGIDVAIEALGHVLAERSASVDDIWRYAKICRIATVMRPYMEALA